MSASQDVEDENSRFKCVKISHYIKHARSAKNVKMLDVLQFKPNAFDTTWNDIDNVILCYFFWADCTTAVAIVKRVHYDKTCHKLLLHHLLLLSVRHRHPPDGLPRVPQCECIHSHHSKLF